MTCKARLTRISGDVFLLRIRDMFLDRSSGEILSIETTQSDNRVFRRVVGTPTLGEVRA